MATKKDKLMGGINSLIGTIEKPMPHPEQQEQAAAPEPLESTIKEAVAKRKGKGGRPRTNLREVTKASQEGCKVNEVRATFIVNETLLEEFKRIAWQKRLKVKDAADMMLAEYIEKHKKDEV